MLFPEVRACITAGISTTLKENYFTNSALKSQLELHTFLSDDSWDKFAIEKRQRILIDFIQKTWLGDIDEL